MSDVSIATVRSKLNKCLGNLQFFTETPFGIEGKTEAENFEISVYDSTTIRVRFSQNDSFEMISYAVIGEPKTGLHRVEENKENIVISTDKIELKITKNPMRICFSDLDGNIINEDDKSFGTSWLGEQVTSYKKLQKGERFIGLGEKTGPLDRSGNGYENWNTDKFGYGPETDPLYGTYPFYMGVHSGLSYGIFFNNSHKSFFNFGASNNRFSSFSADQGEMDYFFFHDKTVASILNAYSNVTGKMTMPPKWSLGYQQCRYSYYPDTEVLSIARTFREKDIPADTIVLDIHYMDQYKIFTWDKERFSDPEKMMYELKSMGFKTVIMCDPGIKVEPGYEAYDDGKEKGVFLKYPDGEDYEGQVWPGWCHFPDFTDPKTRDWWADRFKAFTDLGISGFWNDMNEIATWGNMLPELIEYNYEGEKASSRKGRNLYGFMMSKSTFEGAKKHLNGQRPFNLTRSGFSGIQRYAAVWTGDNVANDEHMLLGVRLVNSLGLAGVPFAGYDVGGFVDNASESLFARWLSIATFSPFFRGHSMINTRDSEPWAYGEEVEEISRNYLKLRYRLLPYIYSAFNQAAETGLAISRSLAIDYTHDALIYDLKYQNQYLFGDAILVAPVESTKDLAKVYLPQGSDWYDLFTGEKHSGGQEIIAECPIEKLPVYVKSSSIIPIQSSINSTEEIPEETLEVHLYYGEEFNKYTYYEDDGNSYNFESGDYYRREIVMAPQKRQLTFRENTGDQSSHFKTIRLYLHGFNARTELLVNHQSVATKIKDEYLFLKPISKFDPIIDQLVSTKITDLPYVEFENISSQIEVSWNK